MVVRNSMYNLGVQVVIKLVSFGFMIFVIRQLGATEFGKYSTAAAFVAILMVLADMGIGSYISREIAQDESKAEFLLGNMIALRLTLSTGFIVVTTALALLTGYNADLVLGIFMISSSQLLFAVQSSVDAVFLGTQRLGAVALAGLVNQLILVGSGVLILLLGYGFLGLIVASLLGNAMACLLNIWNFRRSGKRIRLLFYFGYWPGLLKRSLPFGINQLALSFTYKLDSLMLGWFGTLAVVGMYNTAYNLIFTLSTLSNSINLALFPHMTRQFTRNPVAARRNFGNYLRYLLLLSLPMAVIGSILAEPLAHFLFSRAYTQSGLALKILAWALPLMFLNELLGYIGATLHMEKSIAQLRLVLAGSNLGMNLVAIPLFGIAGASTTTVLTEAIGIGLFIYLFRNEAIFPASPAWLVRPGLAAAAAGAGAFACHEWPVWLSGPLALVVYTGSLLATRAIKPAEFKVLAGAFARRKDTGPVEPESADLVMAYPKPELN
jgi:O-antigen/teichoic acid export membrane protein